MRAWDRFFTDVLPDVPGCPEPTVERHLLRAAREFCAGTGCWREDLPRITTRAGRTSYAIAYPEGADGVTLVGAMLNGRDIGIEVPDGVTTAERRTGGYGPWRVLCEDLRTVLVLPSAPGADLPLVLTMRLQPSEEALGVPDAIGERYAAEIARGALASLLKINKAPWTNTALAADKRAEFEYDIRRVRTKTWRGNSNARPRVSANFY